PPKACSSFVRGPPDDRLPQHSSSFPPPRSSTPAIARGSPLRSGEARGAPAMLRMGCDVAFFQAERNRRLTPSSRWHGHVATPRSSIRYDDRLRRGGTPVLQVRVV